MEYLLEEKYLMKMAVLEDVIYILQHTEEVDYATCQLGYNLTATGHKVWRPI